MPTAREKLLEISGLPSGNTARDHLRSASEGRETIIEGDVYVGGTRDLNSQDGLTMKMETGLTANISAEIKMNIDQSKIINLIENQTLENC